jgi:hypothetical protein
LDWSIATREHILLVDFAYLHINEVYKSIATVLLANLLMKHCSHHIRDEIRGSRMVRN